MGKLPPVNKRIPKTQLFINGGLATAEREVISDRIEEMRLKYVLNPHTYPLEVIKNSDEQYDLILFAEIWLKEIRPTERISRLLQQAIPSALVLIFRYEDEIQFSTALKRLNQNDRTAIVITEYHTGNWMSLRSLTNDQQHFLKSISLDYLPALDYKQTYIHIHRQIYAERYASIVSEADEADFDTVKLKTEQKIELLAEIERLKKQLNMKGTSLREKVKLAGEIKRLESKFN
ncbi:MAG: DUF4391 domain-containing protein [Odoribacter sp.]